MRSLQGLRLLSRCSALEHLDLSHSSVTAAGIAHLCALPRLSSLVLVDCLRAVHPPCMALLTRMPALRSLDSSNNKRLDDACLQALSHAARLTALALNNCTKVSERGVAALARCASLRHLGMDRCPQVGAAALAALQRKLPLLRVARPAGCARVSEALFQGI